MRATPWSLASGHRKVRRTKGKLVRGIFEVLVVAGAPSRVARPATSVTEAESNRTEAAAPGPVSDSTQSQIANE